MEAYIFRHGEIEAKGKFIGFTNSKLTRTGQKQNLQTAEVLKRYGVDRIFSSDLQRTFIVGGVKTPAIREINFGTWENMTWNEIQKGFPAEAQEYLENPLEFKFPGGENFQEFEARIFFWVNALEQSPYRKIGIVTHQGVMRLLSRRYLETDFWSAYFAYGEMLKIVA